MRIEMAYAGANVGQTFSGTRTVNTVVLLPEALRKQPEQLGGIDDQQSAGRCPAVAGGAHPCRRSAATASSTMVASAASA